MASLDFESEKNAFREYYDTNRPLLEDAKKSFVAVINSLLSHTTHIDISKIDGRIKSKQECIDKFSRKYRLALEDNKKDYCIKDHITDLIGIRIVCLYEDDIEKIKDLITNEFDVFEVTDKISQVESTESSFGYKGLHLDVKINSQRSNLPEYYIYSQLKFEIQIRTIIQDSWSVLDHKIKYKKSIPGRLKRRVNTLAALFELADREFREIRDSTVEEIRKEQSVSLETQTDTESGQLTSVQSGEISRYTKLNAFSFLKIASHFFNDYTFEAHKVDGFTQEIIKMSPNITRGKFNYYMKENISIVKKYQNYFEHETSSGKLNPYTVIRHCLYLGDKSLFKEMLTSTAKESFDTWLISSI